jgi:hypothetical protein
MIQWQRVASTKLSFVKQALATIALMTIVASLLSCSAAPKDPDPAALEARAAARIQAIPPATPEKYRGMRDMKGWRNPYLIVRADGVALLDPDDHLERVFKAEELTQELGKLPASAWPYGRVVAVTENGVAASGDMLVLMRKNRAIVAGTLESMQVLINWIPSA